MRPYHLVFSRPAAEYFRKAKGAVFRELESELDRLVLQPHRPADLADRGEDGRPVSIRFLRHSAITYALDDAVREVRVILLESLGR
ncbi:MAG: hypothetical protein RIQ79_1417 [Verrucomicrobiota bacterium]|jgi:hypothetical protein